MNQETYDWLLLLGRWVHITTAITWIGTSIFFMWLDRTFVRNENSKNAGHVGELWMVHGGGFYHVEKLLMGPTKVPEHLHWFKWESYWTWLSGCFLVLLIFYTGNGTFLLDSSVSNITYWQGVVLSLGSMAISWLFYDLLWESKLTKSKPLIGHTLTLIWLAGMCYLLCNTLSGRAAYIHIGAMLGTWMTANVFLRIIPRQVKMVESTKKGMPVNQEWAKNAKYRSTHNTYFTLPVIFIMLSNHFPSTYGNKYNWLILLLMCASGASIRHYFVIRLQKPNKAKVFAIVGAIIILITIFTTRENVSNAPLEPMTSASIPTVPLSGPSANIKGTIKFEGEVPQGKKLALPQGCSTHHSGDRYSNEVIVKDERLKNVLVRITKGLEGKTFGDIPTEPVVLDQRDCVYEPRVVAVRVGQKLEFLNSDPLFHNIRSITKNNQEFNDAMLNKGDRITKIFTKPEIFLQSKCSVHPWMSGFIAVMDHPFFSISNDLGEFEINNIPVGNYTLEVQHEVFGTQTKEISIKENEDQNLVFTFKK